MSLSGDDSSHVNTFWYVRAICVVGTLKSHNAAVRLYNGETIEADVSGLKASTTRDAAY